MIPLAAISIVAALIAIAGDQTNEGSHFFDDRIAPILTSHCLGCHNHELDDGQISFEDRETLLKPRSGRGPAIVLGQPEQSALVRAIQHNGDVQMPPGKKLPAKDIEALTDWVKRGAPWGSKLRQEAK